MWRLRIQASIAFLWLSCWCRCFSFQPIGSRCPRPSRHNPTRCVGSQLHFFNFLGGSPTAATETSSAVANDLKKEVEALLVAKKGQLSAENLEPLFALIEAQNTYDEPNREPLYKGRWHVWFTDCPPPSDGKLGPFQGSAEQEIPDSGKSYDNILRLPPNSKDDEWLNVVLEGIWEDWDGKILSEDNSEVGSNASESRKEDWGAKHWKVTFLRLKFSLFGNEVLSKEFPPNTARVWRTTYLDNNTRIVRAGKTGRIEDETVFYMKRSPRPST